MIAPTLPSRFSGLLWRRYHWPRSPRSLFPSGSSCGHDVEVNAAELASLSQGRLPRSPPHVNRTYSTSRVGRYCHRGRQTAHNVFVKESSGSRAQSLWVHRTEFSFRWSRQGFLMNRPWCARSLEPTPLSRSALVLCEVLESTREDTAVTAFEQLFLERGLPSAIRPDNGVSSASPNALLKPLQALRLVVAPCALASSASSLATRGKTAGTSAYTDLETGSHPTARHEEPAATSALRCLRSRIQHRAAARGVGDEDAGRGLRGLATTLPRRSRHQLPLHDRDVVVTACGRLCMHRKRVNIDLTPYFSTTDNLNFVGSAGPG